MASDNLLEKPICWLHFDNKKSHRVILCCMLSDVSWCGTHVPSLLTFPISCKWRSMVDWLQPSIIDNSRVVNRGLSSIRTFNRSISDSIGRSDLGRSSNDMSPTRNRLDQSRQVRSAIASPGIQRPTARTIRPRTERRGSATAPNAPGSGWSP